MDPRQVLEDLHRLFTEPYAGNPVPVAIRMIEEALAESPDASEGKEPDTAGRRSSGAG